MSGLSLISSHPRFSEIVELTDLQNLHLLAPDLRCLSPEACAELNTRRLALLCQPYVEELAVLTLEVAQLLSRCTPQGRSSVYAHCEQTVVAAQHLLALREGRGGPGPAWLPGWFNQVPVLTKEEVDTLLSYVRHHDYGKPFVFNQDEKGVVHFPGHPLSSARVAAQLGLSPEIQTLILHDSTLHTVALPELERALCEYPSKLLPLQFYAALASLWANSLDFGGEASTSFKIKLKHLSRAYRRVGGAQPASEFWKKE